MSGSAQPGVLDQLDKAASAEEFFALLGVDYDPKHVNVVRLHILRRMGQYLKGSEIDGAFEGLDDARIKALCREHLAQAYQDFIASSPIQERLFKVHQEAVAPKPEPASNFVALDSLKIE